MLMILAYIIVIDRIKEFTGGQGHKVKGQGQINTYANIVKNIEKNQQIDGCS